MTPPPVPMPNGTRFSELTLETGSVRCWASPSGVLLTQISGHGTEPLTRPFHREIAHVLASGRKVLLFHDWSGMTDYDAEVRVEQTRWTKEHQRQVAGLHILVRSRILAMGVTTASLLLAVAGFDLHAYRAAPAFYRELEKALGSVK